MPNTRLGSGASNAPEMINVEEYASGLYDMADQGVKIVPGHLGMLFILLRGLIALQMAIYRELKKDLTETGSKT